jgi:hypothetical protein
MQIKKAPIDADFFNSFKKSACSLICANLREIKKIKE